MAIIPVEVKLVNSDKFIETYAFLDEDSDATFSTTELMNELNVQGTINKIQRICECDLDNTNAVKLPLLCNRELRCQIIDRMQNTTEEATS